MLDQVKQLFSSLFVGYRLTSFAVINMKSKKSEQIAFRVSPEEKIAAERVATAMKTTPGALAGALLEDFVAAREQHGSRLVWPPEFNYYPVDVKTAQDKK